VRLQSLRQVWRWLLEEGGVRRWENLRRRDVEDYVDARLKAGVAASTLNRELRDLWAFLRFVEDSGQRIAPGVFRVSRIKEGKPLPRFLTDEAYQRLEERILEETVGGRRDEWLDRAWFYLLAHGGLRLSELCDLHIRDVDLVGQRLAVRKGKGNRDRIIPLSGMAATALRAYLVVRGIAETDHLLTFRQRPVKATLVQDRLKRYGAAAEVEVSPHRLRHTLATRLLNAGMDIVSIQHLLGHEKLDTTMIYAHVHDTTVKRDFRQAMAHLEAQYERRAGTAQGESTPLVEEFFSHTDQPVLSLVNQEPYCV
jgi:integrase/recombinase XerD